MRLQWVAREIGFEKVSLKNNKLRGTFIADPASGYFQSEKFMKVLNYVQSHPQRTRMKEGEKGLSLTFDRVSGISEARSEEHTSELQSLMRISYAVFCLKKKIRKQTHIY